MQKNHQIARLIFIAIISVVAIISPCTSKADSYKVLDFRNCQPTIANKPISVGNIIQDKNDLKPNPFSGSKSWYIKLQSTSTGKIYPISATTSDKRPNKTFKSNEASSWDWIWSTLTGRKKCSTRAPQNELTVGIAQNLSQTFYLLYPYQNTTEYDIDFATNLKNGTSLLCEYQYYGVTYKFSMHITNGVYSLSAKYFEELDLNGERVTLRMHVDYLASDGSIVPITDSMNVILIKDEVYNSH